MLATPNHHLARNLTDVSVTFKNARVAAGLTQANVATELDVSRSWISQFERGQTKSAALDRVLALAEVLGVTLSMSYQAEEEILEDKIETPEAPQAPQAEDAEQGFPTEPLYHLRSGLQLVREIPNYAPASAEPVTVG